MSLEKLVQLGWYKTEPSSSKEIADLFSIVDRSQADLKVEGISDDLRFQAAYNGVLTLANIGLPGQRLSRLSGPWASPTSDRKPRTYPDDSGCHSAREMGAQDQISLAKEKHHELRLGWRRLTHRSRADHKRHGPLA